MHKDESQSDLTDSSTSMNQLNKKMTASRLLRAKMTLQGLKKSSSRLPDSYDDL